jgi:hypothetical protein
MTILEHMLHLTVTQNQHITKIHKPFRQEHIICNNNVNNFISFPQFKLNHPLYISFLL